MTTSEKIRYGAVGAAVVAVFALGVYFLQNGRNESLEPAPQGATEIPANVAKDIADKKDLIVVSEPKPLSSVTSPLMVRGEARGMWYFEASFPVTLLDGNGKPVAVGYASALLDPNDPGSTWMTEDFVPFESKLVFTAKPATETGTLVLEKDNPSGLPENADELRIPVRFGAVTTAERKVRLYYYDPIADTDKDGNIMCSDAGLAAVERTIPVTQTPIQDTIRLLLQGDITPQEEAAGITTEYPLDGVELTGASLSNGVLTLSFSDPMNKTGGGSCRVGILWFQIRETAKQFDGVEEVRFQPEELFQP